MVSDDQMHREYMEFPEDARVAWSNHTLYTYERAESRRAYRQAHVMKHWDETDRRILFRLILGEIPKQMTDALGMTRQAICASDNLTHAVVLFKKIKVAPLPVNWCRCVSSRVVL